MTKEEIGNGIMAVLFVCAEPIEITTFSNAFDVDVEVIEETVKDMIKCMQEAQDGILLKKTGDKIQLCTNPKYSLYIKSIINPVKKELLSSSVIETLSIVAYKQPVTRGDIEAIRGVRSNYQVSTLLDLGLIKENGRKEVLGRPTLLITTDEFLRHFGISSLDELPTINFEELQKEQEQCDYKNF